MLQRLNKRIFIFFLNLAAENVAATSKTFTAPTDITPIGQFDFNGQIEKLKTFSFPKSGIGKEKRSFQLQWVNKFSWIEYSIERDAIFCTICREFGNQEQQFTNIGYNNWRTALSEGKGLSRHNASTGHLQAVDQQCEKLNRIKSGTSVTEMLSSSVLQKRRYYCKAIVDVILFLASNGLAFRGNWDIEAHDESGLFNQLFEFSMQKDPHLAECQKYMPPNVTYKSGKIQNELIEIIAHLLRKSIVKEIMNADVDAFTVLFDGTKDLNGNECVYLAARFISVGKPTEALIFFETTQDVDANAFTNLLLVSFKKYGLDSKRILSQCYDGAPVMNGYKSGVQKRLQDALGKVIPYVHCMNHKLRLVIVTTVKKVSAVKEFFDQLQLIYTSFKKPKIKKMYEGHALKRLIDTRWTGHYQSTKAVLESYIEIVSVLNHVREDERNLSRLDGDDIATCIGILNVISNKKFVFLLVFMNELLTSLAPADTILQKREMSYRRATPVIESVKSTITDFRNPEIFNQFMDKTKSLMDEAPITHQPVRRIQRRSTRLEDIVVEGTIGERSDPDVEIDSFYQKIIDVTLEEFDHRFSESNEILQAISSSVEMEIDDLKPLENLGIKLPVENELKTAKKYLAKKKEDWDKNDKEESRFNILTALYETRIAFPDVYNLYAYIETFGCSTAVCEASFSALSRVDIPSRVSMTNKRMRNLAFLAFEHKRLKLISIDEILIEFDAMKERKVQLF